MSLRRGETLFAVGIVALFFLVRLALRSPRTESVRTWPRPRVMQPTNEMLPEGELIWIGERAAAELAALRHRPTQVLYANDPPGQAFSCPSYRKVSQAEGVAPALDSRER